MQIDLQKVTKILSIVSIIAISFGIIYGMSNEHITLHIVILGTLIAIAVLFITGNYNPKIIGHLFVFAYLADSIQISGGYFGVNFNLLSILLFYAIAYYMFSNKTASITFGAVGLVLFGMEILNLIVYAPILIPVVIGPTLFYTTSLINIIQLQDKTLKHQEVIHKEPDPMDDYDYNDF